MSYTSQFENFQASNSDTITSISNTNYEFDSGFEDSYSQFCSSIGEYNAFQVGSTNTFLTIVEEYIEAISKAKSTLNAYLEAAKSSQAAIGACYSTDCGAYSAALAAYDEVKKKVDEYKYEEKEYLEDQDAWVTWTFIDEEKRERDAINKREQVWRDENSDLWID